MTLPVGFTYPDADTLVGLIDTTLYSREALFRACYQYTDRCYLFLMPGETPTTIQVLFSSKSPSTDLAAVAGDFFNLLLDHELRVQLAHETAEVRTLLVAQAFAEGNLLDPNQEGSLHDDPRGIRNHS